MLLCWPLSMLQEKMSVQFMPPNMRTAWFELRVTLCDVVSFQAGVEGCISNDSQDVASVQ